MFISRHWKAPKFLIALFGLEFPFTVAALAFFGIASPDTYRTVLWNEGAKHGWNSNPNEVLYAAANYRALTVPMVWTSLYVSTFPLNDNLSKSAIDEILWISITNFNVVISVLSMFILLVKSVMYITHTFPPLLSLFVHALLVALYAVSIHGQSGSDMSDPQHPQPGAPWYITQSCSVADTSAVRGFCQQAKGAFAVTIIMCTIFALHIPLALYSLIPTRAQRHARTTSVESSSTETIDPKNMSPQSLMSYRQKEWEMGTLPRTPGTTGAMKSPMTPRTMAFNTLGGTRDLPLREHRGGGGGEV
ncbi:MAG: hypothetical protein M1830_010294 [Pleopsidium flavum]|nr:MAG: hypothetical protein M1830_010294 [Pleopsidium flavum]